MSKKKVSWVAYLSISWIFLYGLLGVILSFDYFVVFSLIFLSVWAFIGFRQRDFWCTECFNSHKFFKRGL